MTNPSVQQIVKHDQKRRAAIIYVHGFSGEGRSTWSDIWPSIKRDQRMDSWDQWLITYPSHVWPDLFKGLWSADAEIDKLALMLSTAITKTDLQIYESIVLVSHSMGGLVVQQALLKDKELEDKAHAVVFLGTPSGGLVKAGNINSVWRKRQFRDMNIGSDFITQLRSEWDAKFKDKRPFKLLAVAGSNDEFVPGESSLGPFPEECCAVVTGNHTGMIHPAESDIAVSSLIVSCIADSGYTGAQIDSAQIAIERGDFKKVVAELEAKAEQLDNRALVKLAIALDALGERDKAEAYLSARDDVGSDVLGTLGGRLKRKWLLSGRNRDDAKAAQHYYARGLELAEENEDQRQIYYLAINLAFLALLSEQRKTAKEFARKALLACEDCRKEGDEDDWLLAAEGEAHLILGDYDTAYEKYRAFVDANRALWRVSSTYLNAQEIASALDKSEVAKAIDEIFPLSA